MSTSDPGLRRVSVHAGSVHADLALPAMVPVGALIPAIVDIFGDRPNADPSCDPMPARLQLSRPGAPALRASTTLAQNDIQDGAILLLTGFPTELPAPRFDDAAEEVSATLGATAQPWTRGAARLTAAVAACWLSGIGALALIRSALDTARTGHMGGTPGFVAFAGCIALLSAVLAHRGYRDPITGLNLALVATGLFAIAGFLAVPGMPGAANLLLAAMAAAATSMVAMRLTGCGTVTLTAVSGFGLVAAASALTAEITEVAHQAIGSLAALVSLGMLEASPRVSIACAGLAPRLPTAPEGGGDAMPPARDSLADKAISADNWLTGLLAAFSLSAAAGGICAAVRTPGTEPGPGGIAFAAVTGSALLLRARSHTDLNKILILIISGMATFSAAFAGAAIAFPQYAAWVAAVAMLVAAGISWLGLVIEPMSLSPVTHRSVELLEYLALAALVPLACWICGLYPAIQLATRHMNLLTT